MIDEVTILIHVVYCRILRSNNSSFLSEEFEGDRLHNDSPKNHNRGIFVHKRDNSISEFNEWTLVQRLRSNFQLSEISNSKLFPSCFEHKKISMAAVNNVNIFLFIVSEIGWKKQIKELIQIRAKWTSSDRCDNPPCRRWLG